MLRIVAHDKCKSKKRATNQGEPGGNPVKGVKIRAGTQPGPCSYAFFFFLTSFIVAVPDWD